jgi:LmbE family N-acetylglucosaminyl deacetylase
MTNEKEYLPKRAMCIHAHPDDQEFSVAGTLAKWAKAGCEIISVVITSGDSGSNDPSKGAEYKPELAKLARRRTDRCEQRHWCEGNHFHAHPDGELEPTIALRKELTRIIRQHKPDVVVIGDPEGHGLRE